MGHLSNSELSFRVRSGSGLGCLILLVPILLSTLACQSETGSRVGSVWSGSGVIEPCTPQDERQGIVFRDVSHEVGAYNLDRAWGASWRDIDWDGRPDLLWVNHDKRKVSLLRNLDGIRFSSVGHGIFAGGDAHAAALADLNADGLAELFVINGYHLEDWLLEQRAPGVFQPTAREGLEGSADVRGRSATWSDFDGDGDLDLHVQNLNTPDALFLQGPEGSFENSANTSGVQNTFNKFGAAAADLDADGDVDIFVPVLEPMPSMLLLNRGDGVFVDRTFELGLGDAWGARAVAIGDYDNDGFTDLYLAGVARPSVSGMRQGALFHNEAGEGFREVTGTAIESPSCPDTRAAGFFDFDNDGWLDLYIACGTDDQNRNRPNVLLRNQRGTRFVKMPSESCAGAVSPGRTGTFAVGDYNLDGLLDIAVTNGFGALPDSGGTVLLRNESSEAGNWLRVLARGGPGNSDGLGATVTVRLAGGETMSRSVGTQQGMGHNESVVHLGLGS